MTHAELVERAVRWLRNTKKCGVVLAERSCGATGETPDAIGWSRCGHFSYVVECKASRSDFLRDGKKPWRRGIPSLGRERFFFAPPGIVRPCDGDDLLGWGLVECVGNRSLVRTPSLLFERSLLKELGFLYSLARRAQLGVEPTVGVLSRRPIDSLPSGDGLSPSHPAAAADKEAP